GTPAPALDPRLVQLYESFGESESRHGRRLDTLLAAYRIGARVTWAQFSAAAVAGGVGIGDLVILAEAIFVYIDELSAASASGHARQHAAQTGHRDVLRSQLATALIGGEAATASARVRRLAADAGWTMPDRLAVAVLPGGELVQGRPSPVAPPEVLVLIQELEVLAIVPDPSGPGRRSRFTAGLAADALVYVGTVRPPEEAPVSLAHARDVRRLVEDGVLAPGQVVAAADHLPELVLHADPLLLADLSGRVLAPLAALPPRRREVLLETLGSWLVHQGDRACIAEQLAVHPQTVSYRMAQLGELYAGTLQEPRRRLELTLALAALGPRLGDTPWLSQ
ncbi:MAG TPA: helix-turn-helix domain-containing protein, partial [Kineosporiaceae bacterium]|nr:helix-turn-helix domain-containing protein [Kineosporiaceae bacterium]